MGCYDRMNRCKVCVLKADGVFSRDRVLTDSVAEQEKTRRGGVFFRGLSLGGSGGVSPATFGRCGSLHFLDGLLSMNFCEGLSALSFRWTQPYQQQGRRIPSLSSEHTRSTCSRRFSGCLTEKTQQIHSLRASGVISSHAVSALESAAKALRKSAGRSCATPPGIFLVIRKLYTAPSSPGEPPSG